MNKELQSTLLKNIDELNFEDIKIKIKEELDTEKEQRKRLDTHQYRLSNLNNFSYKIDDFVINKARREIVSYYLSNKKDCQYHMDKLVYRIYVSGKRLKCNIEDVDYVGE